MREEGGATQIDQAQGTHVIGEASDSAADIAHNVQRVLSPAVVSGGRKEEGARALRRVRPDLCNNARHLHNIICILLRGEMPSQLIAQLKPKKRAAAARGPVVMQALQQRAHIGRIPGRVGGRGAAPVAAGGAPGLGCVAVAAEQLIEVIQERQIG